jgi:large subunit ribosomal protein L15
MKLNQLRDNPGAHKKRMRVGRGEGSGKGKTCGRGTKGQKARTGVSINGFEGGQNPLYRRLPKRGFNNQLFRVEYAVLNVGDLQSAIEKKRIDPSQKITEEQLIAAGLVKKNCFGVKLLGDGELKTKIDIEVCSASASAKQAVEKVNGTLIFIQ